MNLSEAIQLYLLDRTAKGVKKGSVRNDKGVLERLLADVGNIQVRSLKPQHLDTFWAKHADWAPSTKNRVRNNLNTFFKWCQVRGHMARHVDLLEGHRTLKSPPINRIIIPQAEFATFLDGIENPRTRAAVAIGLYMFTRVSEIRNLRWQDLNLDAGTSEIFREKTVTLDSLPICAELRSELLRWKLTYAAIVGEPVQPGWYVIPRVQPARYAGTPGVKGGFQLTEVPQYQPTEKAALYHSIKDALMKAGYYQLKEGGHTLRRSGAIALYNQLSSVGHDRAIRIVQAMLGHASIRTTEVYLRLDLDRKVRNDLLAGKPMFPEQNVAPVLELRNDSLHRHA